MFIYIVVYLLKKLREEQIYTYSTYYVNCVYHLWLSSKYEPYSSMALLPPISSVLSLANVTFLYIIDLLIYMLFYIIAF